MLELKLYCEKCRTELRGYTSKVPIFQGEVASRIVIRPCEKCFPKDVLPVLDSALRSLGEAVTMAARTLKEREGADKEVK